MMKFINEIKAIIKVWNMTEEEYKRALWEHEQIGYKIYSLQVALERLKNEENETMSA